MKAQNQQGKENKQRPQQGQGQRNPSQGGSFGNKKPGSYEYERR